MTNSHSHYFDKVVAALPAMRAAGSEIAALADLFLVPKVISS